MGDVCSRRKEEEADADASAPSSALSEVAEASSTSKAPAKRQASPVLDDIGPMFGGCTGPSPKARKTEQPEEGEAVAKARKAEATPSPHSQFATAKAHQGWDQAQAEARKKDQDILAAAAEEAAQLEKDKQDAQEATRNILKKRAEEGKARAAEKKRVAEAAAATAASGAAASTSAGQAGTWGTMTAAFDGKQYGEGYLTVRAGEDVFMLPGDEGGWGNAQVQRGGTQLTGYIPTNYFQRTAAVGGAAATPTPAPTAGQQAAGQQAAGRWGRMTAHFDGRQYGQGYLVVTSGEDVFMQGDEEGGWGSAQVQRGNGWSQGYIPLAYWQANE